MEGELESMHSHKVWEFVEVLGEQNLIRHKWVYKMKMGVDRNVETYRVRLELKGYI